MDSALTIALTLLGFVAVYSIGPGISLFQRIQRARRQQQVTRIADAIEGRLITLSGAIVTSGESQVAPITRSSSVFYAAEVERYVPGEQPRWLPHAAESRGVEFWLEDATGRARVHGARLELDDPDVGWREKELTANVESFVVQRGESVGHRLRWRELALVPGDRILATGTARWEASASGTAGGYRETPRQLLLDAPEIGWIQATRARGTLGLKSR